MSTVTSKSRPRAVSHATKRPTIEVPSYRLSCYGVRIMRVPEGWQVGRAWGLKIEDCEPADSRAHSFGYYLSQPSAEKQARAYNSRAKAHKWQTWAFVVQAPELTDLMMETERAQMTRHRGVIDDLDLRHPELSLHGSHWGFDENEFRVSVTLSCRVEFKLGEEMPNIRAAALEECARALSQLKAFAAAHPLKPKLKIVRKEIGGGA